MNETYYDAEIAQKYTILEELGQGGFGTVFKAKQADLQRTVAIKYLSIERSMNERERSHFQNEARILSSLKHPNIVEIYAFGITSSGIPFIVMEYVQGNLLSSEISQGIMPESRAQKIALQLCKAIKAVHEAGIIHRDLKPQNVITAQNGSDENIKLLDFGLSKLLINNTQAQSATATKTGTLIGSPIYMSPEACRGEKGDGRSDIYSWGCIIYECLTGQPPFSAESTMGLLYKHCNELPKSFAEHSMNQPVSPEFEGIILKCLSKDPNKRYANAAHLEEDLTNLQLGKTISIERQSKSSKPTTTKLPLVLLVSSLLLGSIIIVTYFANAQRQTAAKRLAIQTPRNQQTLRSLKGTPEARLRHVAQTFARNTASVEKDNARKNMLLDELSTILSLSDTTHNKKLRYMTYIVQGRVYQAAGEEVKALNYLDKAYKASLLNSGAPSGNGAIPKLYAAQLELAIGQHKNARQSAKTALTLAKMDSIFAIPEDVPFAAYGNMSFVFDAYNTEALAAYYSHDHVESLPLLERAHQYAKEIHKLDMNVEISRLEELKLAEGTNYAASEAAKLFEDIKFYRDDINFVIKHSREGEYYMTERGHIEALSRLAKWFEENQKDSMAKNCYQVILEQAISHRLSLDPATKSKIAKYFPVRGKDLREDN